MEISAKQAAEMLGLTQRRINQLIKAREIKARIVGNSNVVDRASVLAYKKRLNGKSK